MPPSSPTQRHDHDDNVHPPHPHEGENVITTMCAPPHPCSEGTAEGGPEQEEGKTAQWESVAYTTLYLDQCLDDILVIKLKSLNIA